MARRLARWLPVALVLVVLGAAVASYQWDLGERLFGWQEADPRTDPAAVEPPEGLTLPRWSSPAPVAAGVPAARAGDMDEPAVRRVLTRGLEDRDLGRHAVAAVGDLVLDGPQVVAGRSPVIPASTTKLLTATAALATLGPERTFTTRVVAGPRRQVVLVGGGDPYLASRPVPTSQRAEVYPARADVATLARRTAERLRGQGRRAVSVVYDDSLFTGPTDNPRWEPDYVRDGVVSPITALWVDLGRDASGFGRVDDPSAVAAAAFADALRKAGIKVRGAPRPGLASKGAAELAAVESAPLADIVEHALDVSDNEATEVLAHHVGLEVTGEGSFAGGATAVIRTLRELGVRTGSDRVFDGSGLSRANRVSATTLLDVIRTAAAPGSGDLRAVLTGMPVAGFTGSLATRFADGAPEGRGLVRAKTGTLTGVHALAGVVTDREGTAMAFVLAADRVKLLDNLDARLALDELAAEIASCRCSA